MNIGDRVWANYRENSIPTSSLGTIADVSQGGPGCSRWVTVKMDTERNEDGSDLVCVAETCIEPA